MGAPVGFDTSTVVLTELEEDLTLPCLFSAVNQCDLSAEWAVWLTHKRGGCGVQRYYCTAHKEMVEARFKLWVSSPMKVCPQCRSPLSKLLSDNFKAIRI